ncbi:unannotated protein [freshwater metagenome]|uniref:histidine kinase n=1 Tax=freshwater metagenome TaxID=449393 RepID=A0A6J7EZ26_9ZZZZ|nr:HAMP domain-containing protein [Actinomycetota bacterium]
MTRRLVLSYVLLAAFILLVLQLPLGLTFASRAQENLLADVERDSRVLAGLVEERVEKQDAPAVAAITQGYADQTRGRVVVTNADGVSLVDTASPNSDPRDFSTRPEFISALQGTQSLGIRQSTTLDEELAYVAVPISSDGKITGAVRISFPTEEVREEVRENWLRLGALTALILAAAASLGWLVARWAVSPVAELEHGAERLAGGDLSGRAEVDRGPPELQHLAETFNNMAAHLEILVGSQQAFVADASHQLRTPLTAMRLRIESLEDALETPSANADWELLRADAEAISSEVERLTHLVDGLLALARSESSLSLESVDVAAVTAQAVERWQPLAEESGVDVLLTCPATAQARVVRGGLEQILDNLLDNAIGVAPPNTKIALSVSSDSEHVTIRVQDSGPGMTDLEQERATRRFWRAPGAEPGGSGLGLAIVAELAAASGGSVKLSDPPDHTGLEVTVTLVLAPGGVATSSR